MRVLLLHCDWIEFEAKKKAVKSACELDEKTGRMTECIVCFMAVEKPDEKNLSEVVDKLGEVIDSMASQVKAESIVLYPYAHLSSDLSSLDAAEEALNQAYERVSSKYEALKAPFGWYKSFGLQCKGHPLSELSRTITVGGESEPESQALTEEEKIVSHWRIMDGLQNLHELDEFDFKDRHNLRKLASYEKEKKRQADKPPIHIDYMRRLELADYEPASDGGNMRYYPKGRMVKALVEEYVGEKIRDYGGLEVESPIMYDFNHPTLAKYLHRFPARQYTIESDKKNFFLRFAACFGQFLMAHDATLSYRNLPLRLYELARYAFRREKSGELTGLRRLRAFTMPDVHALCADADQAREEYKKRFQLCIETIEGIGFTKDDFELAVRVTKDFYEENKDFVGYLVKEYGKPALVEMWGERKFYFVLKYEFNFVDESEKASALSTDQIDVENGQRYDIKFIHESGESKNPVILHCSPSGAIERVIYALLEKAGKDAKKGVSPSLPLWLSPTQIRFIPVSDKQLQGCREIIDGIEGVRVDLDDRSESMSKKIRQAEKEWIPYTAVVGEKEVEGGCLSVRVRGQKKQVEMTLEELLEKIRAETGGKPFRDTPLPKLLSMRPKFVG
ncbi:MAG: threonine--tRNA ligase [Candidatus Altiarchaeales archaeon]|nr:threonine--tRNA ligase [Candidatus Altiarchaeales archaeon]